MKKKLINLDIETPAKTVFQGKIKYLRVATKDGWLKILPFHAALVSTLGFAPIIFEDEHGVEEHFLARGGIMKVSREHNSIQIYTLDCEEMKSLRTVSVDDYLKLVNQELENQKDMSQFKLKYLNDEKIVLEKIVKQK